MAGEDWQGLFAEALPYGDFLERHANRAQRARWDAVHERVRLSPAQRGLLEGFRRTMHLLVLAAGWCGDCAQQVPILEHLARASAAVRLRVLERDLHPELRDRLTINGGQRVPVVVFLSEDWQQCSVYGDRVLAFYRQMAADALGPACPLGVVPPDAALLSEATAQWLAEIERIQLMLRLTGRLRQLHQD